MGQFSLAIVASQCTLLGIDHTKSGAHRFVVRNTLRIRTTDEPHNLVWNFHLTFFYNFIVPNNVQTYVRGNESDAIQLLLVERFILYLDNPLRPMALATQIVADGDPLVQIIQLQERGHFEQLRRGDMVYYDAVSDCGDEHFFLFHHNICLVCNVYAEHFTNDGLPRIKPVQCLPDKVGFGIVIHIIGNLPHTRQRMQYAQIRAAVG